MRSRLITSAILVGALALLGACDDNEEHEDAGRDAGVRVDAGHRDAGMVDAGRVDAGRVDAGRVDAGMVDAGRVDAGSVDAGPDSGP